MQAAFQNTGSLAHRRIGISTIVILAIFSLCATGCNPRQQIIAEGDFVDVDSTVYHWKEYLLRDTFYREVSRGGVRVNLSLSESEKNFRDSTFSETDYYANGKTKATRNFVAGQQQGLWSTWYETGITKSKSVVDKGILRDYVSYYDDGGTAVTASRAPDGIMSRTDRWRNGNLKEDFITDSLGNGRCTNYFENGKKQQEGTLFRFTPSGDWQRWDSLGNSLSDTTYGTPVTF
jgi:antitoxin component YwqK of YwqJK toxin-antitoxin module